MSLHQLEIEITRICANIFGKGPTNVTYINEGVMNHKFKVSLSDKDYVFRFYITDGKKKLGYEPDLIKGFHGMNAKVPCIYAVSGQDFVSPYNVFIYEWIPGQSLSHTWAKKSSSEREHLCDQIRENYSIISSHKLTGFGEIISESQANTSRWEEFLEDEIAQNRSSTSESNILGDAFDELYEFITAQVKSINQIDSFFLWTDMALSNIITNGNRLQAFVDFEHVLAGDLCLVPAYFFTRESRSFDYSLLPRFFQHEPCSKSTMKFYSVLRLFRISKYLKQPLPTGVIRSDVSEIFPGFKYLTQ